ncbi:MAG: RNA 2',3'-cyclic phosphodiesterase [Armatimonadota bacterium]|nr:RNA 2',3'-cyclic phosphodiesterase [Armatimonadota bacterium]MDR7421746.1 RNA 2',3'-cyclic phosphodiesterase [Armatimonadota bacterium]MDR7453367.1 RNA 2',3'-cyclic phosphodiesterase [Armatimonadota bacterium]MDR7457187.1 RNA 2',3'-cyclic phosphodiesterase [Armatimonadota bacterium]MDR7496073.1 RNA 2',3'-cyclic phosphodiesterase [Armatimonadota bacterium]
MTLHRTFVAVELGERMRAGIARLQEELRAAGARLRWVRPDHLHFTLRFLGELPPAQVARAVVATRDAVATIAPFALTLGGLGAFPSLERPQVVWVGTIAGADALVALARAVNEALARAKFPADGRPFRPHVTLGRARDDRQWGELVRALHRYRDVILGDDQVIAVTVMESRLLPDGPVYTVREQVPLSHGLNARSK